MILRPCSLILFLAYYSTVQQDRQCMYNATVKRVRKTVVAVENYTFWDSPYAATATTTTTTRIIMLFTVRVLYDILVESNQIQWSVSLHTLFWVPYVQNDSAFTKPSSRRYSSRPQSLYHTYIFDIVAYTAIVYLYYSSAFIYNYVVILIFVTGCILTTQQYTVFFVSNN
jgi:hypothetical protein